MEEDKPFTSISILDTYLGKNENQKMLLKIFSDHNNQVEKLIGKDFAAGKALRYSTATSQDEFNSEKLLPALSNQKMNAYLKEIADLCEVNKILTFHLARHNFGTTNIINQRRANRIRK